MFDSMFEFEDEAMLVQDREDLIEVLRLRFVFVPPEVISEIYEIKEMNEIERLILAAANVPTWDLFMKDFSNRKGAFRIAGDQYNPLQKVRYSGK
jgi:hypothetical protein